jgi:hypothetical protein
MSTYPYEPVPAIIDLYDRSEEIDFGDDYDDLDEENDGDPNKDDD